MRSGRLVRVAAAAALAIALLPHAGRASMTCPGYFDVGYFDTSYFDTGYFDEDVNCDVTPSSISNAVQSIAISLGIRL